MNDAYSAHQVGNTDLPKPKRSLNRISSATSGLAKGSGNGASRGRAKRPRASVPEMMLRFVLNPEKHASKLSKMHYVFGDTPGTLDTERFEEVFGQPYPEDINVQRVAEFTTDVWMLLYSRKMLASMHRDDANTQGRAKSWWEEEQLLRLERDTPVLDARVKYFLECFKRDNVKLYRLAKKYLAMAEAECKAGSRGQ